MKSILSHTRNSLPKKIRIEIAELLQARLADSIDLMMQAKQAHWNLKGPHFFSLHGVFDKVFTDTVGYVDLIAERIVQLGGVAQGTIRAAVGASGMPEYPLNITSGHKHVAELAHALAFYGETIRKAIVLATELGDAGTADIFTQVSRGTDINLWFVEAHEQAEN
ncbi:MAG: DNA starvation/stationary phase protection protein Dps [Luteolibacter sp.]